MKASFIKMSSCKKILFVFNISFVFLLFIFIFLRFHNNSYFDFKLEKYSEVKIKRATKENFVQSSTTPLKIPWRFQIEEDGFVFPSKGKVERFITYEPVKGSWAKQIIQFENANVFASLLKRTLIVPPLYSKKSDEGYSNLDPYESNMTIQNKSRKTHYMSELINFDLLSSMVKLGKLNDTQVKDIELKSNKYTVCSDPRLGFWLDYIPSVENIQTWRVLKEQYFSPVMLNLNGTREIFACPGSLQYLDRWGPPLKVKARYRGILTELSKREEEILFFQGGTLNTNNIRFFNKQRARKAQELLLFYIRFSNELTKKINNLANILGHGFTAVLAQNVQVTDEYVMYVTSEAERIGNPRVSKTLLVVSDKPWKIAFMKIQNYKIVFADELVVKFYDDLSQEEIELLSLLLCIRATHFISLPGTPDLYFVEHLRLQDATMVDGLVTNNVNVRWAKHTTRKKADDHKVYITTTKSTGTLKENIPPRVTTGKRAGYPTAIENKATSKLRAREVLSKNPKTTRKLDYNIKGRQSFQTNKLAKRKVDRVDNMACLFCKYIRYVTGKSGCPEMKKSC